MLFVFSVLVFFTCVENSYIFYEILEFFRFFSSSPTINLLQCLLLAHQVLTILFNFSFFHFLLQYLSFFSSHEDFVKFWLISFFLNFFQILSIQLKIFLFLLHQCRRDWKQKRDSTSSFPFLH